MQIYKTINKQKSVEKSFKIRKTKAEKKERKQEVALGHLVP